MPVEPREFKEEPIEQVASNFVELGLTSDSLGQNFDGIVEGLGLVNFPQEKKEKLLDRMRRIEGAMVNEDPNALTTSVSFEDGTLELPTEAQSLVQPELPAAFNDLDIDAVFGTVSPVEELDLDSLFGEPYGINSPNVTVTPFTTEASQDAFNIAKGITGQSDFRITSAVDMREVEDFVLEQVSAQKKLELDEFIHLNEDPVEIQNKISEYLKFEKEGLVTNADLRTTAVANELELNPIDVEKVREQVNYNLWVAESLDQLSAKIWEDTSTMGAVGDFAEFLIPFSGYVEEEVDKWSADLAGTVKSLYDAGSREEATKILDGIYEMLQKNNTMLLGNNNAFLNMSQLERISSEFRSGAESLLNDESISPTQRAMLAESLVFGGFEATGLGTVKRLGSGIATVIKRSLPNSQPPKPKAFKVESTTGKATEAVDEGVLIEDLLAEEEAKLKSKLSESRLKPSEIKDIKAKIQLEKIKIRKAEASKKDTAKLKPAARKRVQDKIDSSVQESKTSIDELSSQLKSNKEQENIFKQLTEIKGSNRKFVGKKLYKRSLRESASQVDAVNAIKPLKTTEDLIKTGVRGVQESSGLTQDEMISRLLPDNQLPVNSMPDPKPQLVTMNELLLASVTPKTAGMNRALNLQKQLGKGYKLDTANIVIKGNNDEASFGDFQYVINNSKGNRFETVEEAKKVQERLFGIESEVLKFDTGYSVVAEIKHTFNPKFDTSSIGGKVDSTLSNVGTYLVDPLRRLGKEMVGAVQVLSDVNTAHYSKLVDKFNSAINAGTFKGFDSGYRRKLATALDEVQKMGDDGKVFTRADLQDLKMRMSPKEEKALWESISEIKEVADELYRVTDKNFRLELEQGGWKTLPNDSGDEFNFVRQLKSDDFKSKQGKDLGKFEEGTKVTKDELVLDLNTGKSTKLDELEDSKQVVMAMNLVADGAGGQYRLVIPKGGLPSVKPLPKTNLLNKREGYIPRMYKDVGYRVTQQEVKHIGGKPMTVDVTTHLVKSQDEAAKIVEELKEQGVEAVWSSSREEKNKNLVFGRDNDVSYGFGSIHTNAKGEMLEGAEGGFAEVLDPISALAKRMSSLQAELGVSSIESLKTRYDKTFARYRDKQRAWHTLKDDTPWMVKNQADTFKSYVERLAGVQNGVEIEMADRTISYILGERVGIDYLKNRKPVSTASDFLKANATNIYITGRPLFQIPTNMLQVMSVLRRYPVQLTKAVMDGVVNGMMSMANKLGTEVDNYGFLSKRIGVDVDTYKDIEDYVYNRSGLVKGTSMTDDILSLNNEITAAGGGLLRQAGRVAVSPFKGLKMGSTALQEGALKLVNTASFWAELNADIARAKKAGKAWEWNPQTAERIHLRSRQLTNTQNKVNKFEHQNSGLLSMSLQFMQHVHKMFLDDVLDPALKVTTGRTIGEASVNAEKWGVAARVTLFNLGMFGGAGLVGDTYVRDLYQELGEEYPELLNSDELHWTTARFILEGGALNQFASGLTSRVSPAAMVDTITMVIEKPAWEMLFGASLSAATSVFGGAYNVGILANNPEMNTKDKVFNAGMEIARVLAGAKDAERAYVATQMGTLPYFNTLSGNINVTEKEALMTLFSITPESALTFYNESADVKGKKSKPVLESVKDRVNGLFIRAMNRELASMVEDGKLDMMQVVATRRKYIELAKASHGNNGTNWDKVEQQFYKMTSLPETEHYESYIKPFVNANADWDETYENLKFLASTTEDVKFKEFINSKLSLLEFGRTEEELTGTQE